MSVQKRDANRSRERFTSINGIVDKIDNPVSFFLRSQYRLTDQQITGLREVSCPAKVNGENATIFRVYNPAITEEKGIPIEGFKSLDSRQSFILYDGYFTARKRKRDTVVSKREEGKHSLLEEKIKRGDIIDIGLVSEKAAVLKWRSKAAGILTIGGFFLIFAALVLVVVVSIK